MKIMIGHEDNILREVLSVYCKTLTYTDCQGFKINKDAIEAISSQHYDVWILNYRWLSSLEYLQNRSFQNQLKPPLIIALTTDYSKNEEQWCEKNGVSFYVQLPISFSLFKLLISE